MAVMKIHVYPDPVLKQKCSPVTKFDRALADLLENMFETMYTGEGIGLAGPQVGVTERLLVTDVTSDRSGRLELINPEIIETEGKTSCQEGCLSIPGYRDTVNRHKRVKVRAQNRRGEEILIDADDLLSICIQHEMDHLDGIMFVDRISRLKRELFKSWLKKHPASDET